MTVYLRQSTASQEVPLGFFLDSTDGNTEETALTIANTDIKIWKAGATTLASKSSGGATHITKGVYYCTLDATDTDTLGSLVIFVHVTGALSVRQEFVVVTANWYDTMFSTDALDVNVTTMANDTITAAVIATDAIDADAIKTDAVTELQTGLSTASALAAAKVVVDAIKVVTDAQGATGTGLSAVPWNAAWDAEVQSECTDALNAYDPPTKTEMDAIGTPATIADAVWDEVLHTAHEVENSASVLVQASGSLGDPWATTIPGSYGAGTAGKIIGDNLNAPVGTVDTVVDAIKAELDDIHDTDLPAVKTETAAILLDTGTTLDTLIKDIPTTAEFEARSLPSADYVVVGDTIARVTLVDTCTANTDMRGTDSAALASVCTEARLAELSAANLPADIDAILLDTGTTLDALIKRSLGLMQENFRIASPVYSTSGKMTSCTMKIYPTATDCTDDTNVLATYTVTATYDVSDNLATYKVVKA